MTRLQIRRSAYPAGGFAYSEQESRDASCHDWSEPLQPQIGVALTALRVGCGIFTWGSPNLRSGIAPGYLISGLSARNSRELHVAGHSGVCSLLPETCGN